MFIFPINVFYHTSRQTEGNAKAATTQYIPPPFINQHSKGISNCLFLCINLFTEQNKHDGRTEGNNEDMF